MRGGTYVTSGTGVGSGGSFSDTESSDTESSETESSDTVFSEAESPETASSDNDPSEDKERAGAASADSAGPAPSSLTVV